MELAEKTVLVTGGGRGIGKGCAVELARQGADVVLNDVAGSAETELACREIEKLGRKCHLVPEDVFSRAGCERLIAATLDCVPSIDALISNPAYSRRCDFLDYPAEEFEKTLAATLTSGFHMSQLVARHMVQRGGGGKIVFISSVQAEMPMARSVAYGAAKAGLNLMARTIAVELAQHKINVNVIQPGWIDTPGERVAFSEDVIEQQGAELPWKRLGTPADIGHAAAFLVSAKADYITGTIVSVDGGFRDKHCAAQRQIETRQ